MNCVTDHEVIVFFTQVGASAIGFFIGLGILVSIRRAREWKD